MRELVDADSASLPTASTGGGDVCMNVCIVSFFLFVWRCGFFRLFFFVSLPFSLCREYVVRSFLPDGVFLPCDHGLDF